MLGPQPACIASSSEAGADLFGPFTPVRLSSRQRIRWSWNYMDTVSDVAGRRLLRRRSSQYRFERGRCMGQGTLTPRQDLASA